jgi:hypothetical protein
MRWIAVLLLFSSCQSAPRPEPIEPVAASLTEGWNEILPGGDTICAVGTEFSYWVRPASPERVLVYFQGGGACSSGESCDLRMSPTYDPVVNDEDSPQNWDGIFALDHPENPFADWTMVMIPYCTGDVHLGANETTYDVPATDSTDARQTTIQHRGSVNSLASLEWLASNFFDARELFVTGGSAGSIPSPFYADWLATRYADARIVQLGDGSGGYGTENAGPVIPWGLDQMFADKPGYVGLPADSLHFLKYYEVGAKRHPDVQFAAFDFAHDEVQAFFMGPDADGNPPDVIGGLERNYKRVRAADQDFRAYLAAGDDHTILGRRDFYTLETSGARLVEWVHALAEGRPVDDVTCSDC